MRQPLSLANWGKLWSTGAMGNFLLRKESLLHLHGFHSALGPGAPVLLDPQYEASERNFLECMMHVLKGPLIVIGSSALGLTDQHFQALWVRCANMGVKRAVHVIISNEEGLTIMERIRAISPAVAAWADDSICVHLYGQEFDDLAIFVSRLQRLVDEA